LDCFALEKKEERDNMMEEERAMEEFFEDYFQTPETPSSSHFSSASSSSSSSSAGAHEWKHGDRVIESQAVPHNLTLLMHLRVFYLLAAVFAVVPMGANAGAMSSQRLRAPDPSRTPWAAPLLLGAHRGQVPEPSISFRIIIQSSEDCAN